MGYNWRNKKEIYLIIQRGYMNYLIRILVDNIMKRLKKKLLYVDCKSRAVFPFFFFICHKL